jgi:hypothetical protein
MLISKLNHTIKPPRLPQGSTAPKRLNISKLKNIHCKQSLVDILDSQMGSANIDPENIESSWTAFKELLYYTPPRLKR